MRAPASMELLHLRATEEQADLLRERARRAGSSLSSAFRTLLQDQLEGRRSSSPSNLADQELQLHLLVAVEQVLCLVESILPEGPGAAEKVLAEAAQAAQRRLSDSELARWWGASE